MVCCRLCWWHRCLSVLFVLWGYYFFYVVYISCVGLFLFLVSFLQLFFRLYGTSPVSMIPFVWLVLCCSFHCMEYWPFKPIFFIISYMGSYLVAFVLVFYAKCDVFIYYLSCLVFCFCFMPFNEEIVQMFCYAIDQIIYGIDAYVVFFIDKSIGMSWGGIILMASAFMIMVFMVVIVAIYRVARFFFFGSLYWLWSFLIFCNLWFLFMVYLLLIIKVCK